MRRYDIAKTIILDKTEIDNNFKQRLESQLINELDKRNKFILNNIMKKILYISLALFLLIGGGYLVYTLTTPEENPTPIETSTENENTDIGIANPASTNCVEKGGTLQLEDNIGYCIFDDGSKCEEWEFFRGECEKGDNK